MTPPREPPPSLSAPGVDLPGGAVPPEGPRRLEGPCSAPDDPGPSLSGASDLPAPLHPCGEAPPILNCRDRIARSRRWAAPLLTLGVWGAAGAALAPVLLVPAVVKGITGLALGGALVRRLRALGRTQPSAQAGGAAAGSSGAIGAGSCGTAAGGPSRQNLAASFGLRESTLFRARHARICTVHHDGQGAIVGITQPRAPMPADAHPSG